MDDEYHRARSPDWSKVTVPFLSAANWGGQGLHPRGNFEGFYRAASKQKWLEAHGIEHWTHFYTDYGRELQLRFFDHFLKDNPTADWDQQPPVLLQVRHPGERFEPRAEQAWPIPRTQWTSYALGFEVGTLAPDGAAEGTISFDANGDGLMFLTPPLEHATEITGPSALTLFVSSSTADADLFVVLRIFARPTCGRKPSRARSIRTPRSHKAGCAPRIASLTRRCHGPGALTTRMTTRSR